MIEIKPDLKWNKKCPNCGGNNPKFPKTIFTGSRILAEIQCSECNLPYLEDFPVGHAAYYPKSIDPKTNKTFPNPDISKTKWFTKNLSNAIKNKTDRELNFKRKILSGHFKEVIIINCLDFLYGHVLLKIFNSYFYHSKSPQIGVVLLIPESFEWLVPAYVAEVWTVNIRLNEGTKWFAKLDAIVQPHINSFSKVYLSPAYSHPDLSKIKIADFTKVEPFNITEFEIREPTITIVYREDRLWYNNRLEEFIFEMAKQKSYLKFLLPYFVGIQKSKIRKFIKLLKSQFSKINIHIVGFGKSGDIGLCDLDLRTTFISEQIEHEWCKVYAQSHLVIGVHGSNMLLPTAHSGGFIELLPKSRINNITQDVFARYSDRLMLYLGRMIDIEISPKQLALLVTKVIKGYGAFNLYTNEKYLKFDSHDDSGLLQEKFSQIVNRKL